MRFPEKMVKKGQNLKFRVRIPKQLGKRFLKMVLLQILLFGMSELNRDGGTWWHPDQALLLFGMSELNPGGGT